MNLMLKAHLDRVERLKGTRAKQNPVMWMNGAVARLGAEETIDHLFYDGYASISMGYIGVWECCEALGRAGDKEFAISILQYMKNKCEEYKEQTRLGFSLYGTPSESFCYKAANAIKREFGEEAMKGRDYLTNSFHYPVWLPGHPVDKWGWETGFAQVSSAGHISYVEAPNLEGKPETYEGILDYACAMGLHYFAINCAVDQCFECGFKGEIPATEEGYKCSCGNDDPSKMSVIRRVSGYISAPTLRPFNHGKQQEVTQRVKHV